jgi:hypothetical protein
MPGGTETRAELQKILKDNAEALRENAEALRGIYELITNSGLPKIKLGGGRPKVFFVDGLKYVTGQSGSRVAFMRFRKFLAEGVGCSEQQIDRLLLNRYDCWPAIRREIKTDERVTPGLDHGIETYPDYGGFLLDELEPLKERYQYWWHRQMNVKRKKNLPSRRKKKEEESA